MKSLHSKKSVARRRAPKRKIAAAVRSTKKRVPKTRAVAKPPKLDLGRIFQSEYVAPRDPVLLTTKPACYLAVEGVGQPGGRLFQARISALYGIAYTVKMSRKTAGAQDYTVNRLEARYLNLGEQPMPPPEQWQWQLLIRTPGFVTADDLARAVESLRKRRKEGDAALVTLVTIDEGPCIQMLHVGPYNREGETVEAMRTFARTQGLQLSGPHHEIYISDPRRVAAEKLKTILRVPVTKAPVEPPPAPAFPPL